MKVNRETLIETLLPFAEAIPKPYYGDWSSPVRIIHVTEDDLVRCRATLKALQEGGGNVS